MKFPWKPLKGHRPPVLELAVAGIEVLRSGGVFRSVEHTFAGSCRTIAPGGSALDIQMDRHHGVAYLSLLERDSVRGGQSVHDAVTKRVTKIYMDGGAAISAGSTTASWRDEFLIGALSDPKVLLCKPNS